MAITNSCSASHSCHKCKLTFHSNTSIHMVITNSFEITNASNSSYKYKLTLHSNNPYHKLLQNHQTDKLSIDEMSFCVSHRWLMNWTKFNGTVSGRVTIQFLLSLWLWCLTVYLSLNKSFPYSSRAIIIVTTSHLPNWARQMYTCCSPMLNIISV